MASYDYNQERNKSATGYARRPSSLPQGGATQIRTEPQVAPMPTPKPQTAQMPQWGGGFMRPQPYQQPQIPQFNPYSGYGGFGGGIGQLMGQQYNPFQQQFNPFGGGFQQPYQQPQIPQFNPYSGYGNFGGGIGNFGGYGSMANQGGFGGMAGNIPGYNSQYTPQQSLFSMQQQLANKFNMQPQIDAYGQHHYSPEQIAYYEQKKMNGPNFRLPWGGGNIQPIEGGASVVPPNLINPNKQTINAAM